MFRNFITHILAFLMMISLIAIAILSIIHFKIADEDFILDSINKSQFVEHAYKEVRETLDNNLGVAGLDPENYEHIVTISKVKDTIRVSVQNIFNENYVIDLDDMQEEFYTTFLNKLKSETPNPDENKIASIKLLAKEATNTFRSYFTLNSLRDAGKYIVIIKNIIVFLYMGCLLLFVISLYFIYKKKSKVKSYLIYYSNAFLAASLVLIVPALVLIYTEKMTYFNAGSFAVYDLVQVLFDDIVKTVVLFGFVYLLFGVILFICNLIINRKRIARRSSSNDVHIEIKDDK